MKKLLPLLLLSFILSGCSDTTYSCKGITAQGTCYENVISYCLDITSKWNERHGRERNYKENSVCVNEMSGYFLSIKN